MENLSFPVDFPLNQSIESLDTGLSDVELNIDN